LEKVVVRIAWPSPSGKSKAPASVGDPARAATITKTTLTPLDTEPLYAWRDDALKCGKSIKN
jgi:hypothetical protein